MFGAIQMVEYDPSQTDKVVNALHKFVQVANTMLHNGQGMEIWTQTRWADFVMSLEWLYDNHPNGKEDLLIDTMKQVKYAGVPWEEVFTTKNFPTIAVDTLQNPTGYVLSWHGVNLAEGIKALPAAWRFTHNESDLTRTSEGWDLLYKYHGRPSGAFSADEYLAGLEATRGSELCSVVEMMFSNSYLFQIMGDLKYLDKAEKTAYNALPATITADHWAHQYNQQQNQIASRNMTPNPFYVDGPYANVFGLEPYYPCCTVNHPQGWPKFITHSFLTTNDRSSLIQVYHGPLQVETTLSGNNKVSVNVDTLYPFSDVVTTTINAGSSYTHFVRIPSWVAGGTFSINGATQQPLKPTNGLQSFSISSGKTTIILNLTPQITTEARLHGSIAVHRGPLHYALDISYNSHILKADPDEPRAADYQFDATSDWQFAIDPSTFKFVSSPPADGKLPSPIYDSNLPPVAIEVSACPIQWKEAGQTFAAPPPQNPRCVGDVRTIKLTPYGSTKLRISEFPVFSA
ncbi:hypothetical protein VNI00_004348 [Paramarasmius palmivorus]|uniref:Uncharacterized protein n=1 Tax=Paramarasmius palmivorus TaxID=297713 RepID=A0AAW0DMK8_9AGAR